MKFLIPKFQCQILLFFVIIFGSFICAPYAGAISISARISDQYTEVSGGDRLYFEVEIKYPENPRRKDLRLEYQIVEEDEIIASEKVLRAVETQISFLDYIVVPQGAKSGIHKLNIIITDYENLNQEVSATFKVLKGRDQATNYFFILLGAVIIVAVLVITQIIWTNRKEIGKG